MANKMFLIFLCLLFCFNVASAETMVRGIYLTQHMAEDTKFLQSTIANAKKYGINTFVIDVFGQGKRYNKSIALVRENGITYIARIIVFPHGGTADQVKSRAYWEKKYKLAEYAASLGAKEIQLDYIRYNTKQKQVHENAYDIKQVLNFFKQRLAPKGVKLQIAVFGESCFKPSLSIGQNINLFASTVDSISPMVYPSHYFPYAEHSQKPYDTVYDSLVACRDQYENHDHVKMIPYIEVFNVRYRIPNNQRAAYIYRQIKAAEDAGAEGWFAWSATNKYQYLYQALAQYPIK